jgi:hypothetical protein
VDGFVFICNCALILHNDLDVLTDKLGTSGESGIMPILVSNGMEVLPITADVFRKHYL